MTRIVVTVSADADIDAIIAHMAAVAGLPTAQKYLGLIEKVYERLAAFPGSGPPRPTLGPLARIAVISPYVLIYDWDSAANTATILRVVHGRRRITRKLARG
ncbi:MAG: type II toxin-antitoxin system RelE/ParE family toxin [Hyphomicrobium aestuarii]|nr:type II toxin-antitoxin system RelE/ParE family toxin [Hyphomicrobium aestuarii]